MSDDAARFREIVGRLAEAVEELRDRDAARVVELGGELPRLEAELRKAITEAALSRAGVALRWEEAEAMLWAAGARGRVRPEPDPAARPDDLDGLNRAVETAVEDLRESTKRRLFGR